MELMKAAVFRGPGTIEIEERKKPVARAGEAVIRVTTTTICGTDVHIVKGETPGNRAWISETNRLAILNRSATDSKTTTSWASAWLWVRSRHAGNVSTA